MTDTFAAPTRDDTINIRDFTIKKKHVQFKIDDDVFTAHAILGLPLMQNMVRVSKNMRDLVTEERFDALFDVFDQLLTPDSARRFRERAMSIGDDAIDLREQLIPILHYLLESYGIRPTRPSSDSLTGLPSETDGTTLTDGFAQTVSS